MTNLHPSHVPAPRGGIVRGALLAALCSCGWLSAAATEPAPSPRALLEQAKRVVVLGDSITYGGRWVAILTSWMEAHGMTADVIDVGLSSETVSGLSESTTPASPASRPASSGFTIR